MASTSDWLQRLDQATDYRELQAVFSEIAADARHATDGAKLVESIDEAIRRVEKERFRDEAELKAFEEEYNSFKDQQSGVVGWFKRHLPFTETRRAELGHRETVSDQQAEILADNLIIARAQMIKEKVLEPDRRTLGYSQRVWSDRLNRQDSVVHLAGYAETLKALTQELVTSRSFVDQLHEDVEAFAAADFADKEDRRRKEADLKEARSEVEELRTEVNEEESLRLAAVRRIGQLIVDELTGKDPDFRSLEHRVNLCAGAVERTAEIKSAAKALDQGLDQLVRLEKEARDLPDDRDRIDRKLRGLKNEAEDAQQRYSQLAAATADHAARHDELEREVQHAERAVDGAKQLYDAYIREQQDKSEIESFTPIGSASPVENEYLRLKQELEELQANYRAVSVPYQSAKSESDRAKRTAADLERDLAGCVKEGDALARRESELRNELSSAHDRVQSSVAQLRPLVDRYLDSLQPLSWTTALPDLSGLSLSRSRADADSAQRFLHKFQRSLKGEQKALSSDLSASQDDWKRRWRQRCQELLDPSLVEDVSNANAES